MPVAIIRAMNNVERNGCTLGVSSGNITMILEVANLNIRPGGSADFERALAEAQAVSAARAVSTDRQRISGFALGISRGNINMIPEVANLNLRTGDSADFERALAEAQAVKTSQVLIDHQAVIDCRSS